MNSDKIVQITPTDVMNVVSEYSRNRGVIDETNDIPVDLNLLDYEEIRKVIEKQGELGSKNALHIDPTTDEGTDYDVPEEDSQRKIENESNSINENEEETEKNDTNDPVKQFRTYYARILFYSFLTEDKVMSLENVIKSIEDNIENRILSINLGLNLNVLKSIRKYINWSILNNLDYKIQNINNLSKDESLEPIQRAKTAVNKFNKLSESEVVTPDKACKEMLCTIPQEDFKKILLKGGKFLDISSKMGEFPLAIYELAVESDIAKEIINDSIYAIPTSIIAYEFTKKIYKILGLNINNIAKMFNSYKFLEIKNNNDIDYDKIKMYLLQDENFSDIELKEDILSMEGQDKMKFDVVIGNPPYQQKGGSGGNNDALIFQYFANIAKKLDPTYISLIIPSRWFSAGRENLVGEFRKDMLNNKSIEKMVVYTDASEIFESVEIKGGVCYYLINKNYKGDCNYTLYQDDTKEISVRDLSELNILIREPQISSIVNKVINSDSMNLSVDSIISNDTPFGIGSNPISGKKYTINVYEDKSKEHNTLLFYIDKQKRQLKYVKKSDIKKNVKDINKYKVFIPANAGSGNDPYILGKPEIADKNSVCSQSYLYSAFNTKEEAKNFVKYMQTKFFRILVKALKITQGAPSKVYKFVPMQDFSKNSDINWNADIVKINKQLCKKYNISSKEIEYIEKTIKPLE